MGFRTISYGPRGSATLIKDQLDRLLACEWMIRWDSASEGGEREFGIKEIKLTNEYTGVDRRTGSFVREITMTEGFFEHLRHHAVPLNETAIRQLRDSATALDLYTWLAYRLPRISAKRPASISWQQLAVHFGNDGKNIRKFRQTVRDAWERHVSAVYPEARADFDTTLVRLYASPAPLQQTLVAGKHLRLVADEKGTPAAPPPALAAPEAAPDVAGRFIAAIEQQLGQAETRAWFKDCSLEQVDDAWVLLTRTRFIADWMATRFDQALRRAAVTAGMNAPPLVRPRQGRP
jgi:hypothetical protein